MFSWVQKISKSTSFAALHFGRFMSSNTETAAPGTMILTLPRPHCWSCGWDPPKQRMKMSWNILVSLRMLGGETGIPIYITYTIPPLTRKMKIVFKITLRSRYRFVPRTVPTYEFHQWPRAKLRCIFFCQSLEAMETRARRCLLYTGDDPT